MPSSINLDLTPRWGRIRKSPFDKGETPSSSNNMARDIRPPSSTPGVTHSSQMNTDSVTSPGHITRWGRPRPSPPSGDNSPTTEQPPQTSGLNTSTPGGTSLNTHSSPAPSNLPPHDPTASIPSTRWTPPVQYIQRRTQHALSEPSVASRRYNANPYHHGAVTSPPVPLLASAGKATELTSLNQKGNLQPQHASTHGAPPRYPLH